MVTHILAGAGKQRKIMEDEPGVSRHTRGRNNARQSRLCPPSSSPSARPYVLTFSLLFISHVFKLIFKGTMSQILIRKGHNFYASYQCILRQDFGCCLIRCNNSDLTIDVTLSFSIQNTWHIFFCK